MPANTGSTSTPPTHTRTNFASGEIPSPAPRPVAYMVTNSPRMTGLLEISGVVTMAISFELEMITAPWKGVLGPRVKIPGTAHFVETVMVADPDAVVTFTCRSGPGAPIGH